MILTLLLIQEYHLSLWVLAGLKFLDGVFGSWPVIVIAAFAYISDITPPETRTSIFVYIEASFFLAFTIGPLVGGILTKVLPNGVMDVFRITLGIEVFVLLYIIFILKESRELKPASSEDEQNSFMQTAKKALSSTFSVFWTATSTSQLLLLAVMFSIGLAFGASGVFFLWAASNFAWASYEQGIYLFIFSSSRMLCMVLLFPFIKMIFKASIHLDAMILRTSIFILCCGAFAMGLATQGWMVLVIAFVDGMGALATPTVRGLLSKSATADQQGSLFSGIQVIQNFGSMVSGFVFSNIWAVTVGTKFSSAFLFMESFVSLWYHTRFLDYSNIVIQAFFVAFLCALGYRPVPEYEEVPSNEDVPSGPPLEPEVPSS